MDSQKLTAEEIELLRLLAEAYDEFTALPDKHSSDVEDFTHHIHILQRHVMARLARRANPEIFNP